MTCTDCKVNVLCIPVPGLPGTCTFPDECEQCIARRLDAVERDIASTRVDVDRLEKKMDDLAGRMARFDATMLRISRENKKIAGQFDGEKIAAMIDVVEKLKKLTGNILVHVT